MSLWQAQSGALDGSEALIWLLAVATAVGGALWAGHEYSEELAYLGSKRAGQPVRRPALRTLCWHAAAAPVSRPAGLPAASPLPDPSRPARRGRRLRVQAACSSPRLPLAAPSHKGLR